MVRRAMGGRWTACGMQLSCFALLILGSQIHGCWSLNPEGLALFQFQGKVNFDPYGALANWNPNDSDPCMWLGIECVGGEVVTLDLSGRDLGGILALELANLTHLRFLDLSKNRFSGTIPPQFGQIATLEVLDLRDNNLSGKVPAELGRLHSLKRLLLCNNRFEGSIPVEIEKLSLLNDLQFDDVPTTAANGIGCVNRKFGHCVWQNVVKQSKRSHSIRLPIKWSITHYLNLLPQFKFGSAFKLGSELSHNHADDGGSNLTDSPQPGVTESIHKQVNIMRRILVEQPSNLIALPPSIGAPPPSENAGPLPSRSSGSFPAIPNGKKPSPAPVPSPTSVQENTTNPGSASQPNDKNLSTSSGNSGDQSKLIIGILSAVFLLIIAVVMVVILRSRAARNIGPWKSGLSGQLQKAFVTGVPKLNRGELETACEDFSNIIFIHDGVATLYKGTLSSGVEIAVASTAIGSLNEWSNHAEIIFRNKIDGLSRINHKNFANLLGYCEENEPFTRMMVFEYAPNGTLFEHMHVKELEHLDWSARMRIIMGTAYCLQHMHDLSPPAALVKLTTKEIYLTDDYAAKVADVSFWTELIVKSKNPTENVSEHSEVGDVETNIYSFGMLLLEVISGRLPNSEEQGNILNWAAQYLNDKRNISQLIDPTLKSFKENELEVICDVIQSCIQQDPRKRSSMKEVVQILRQALDISPEAATPRLSPLWWAELEILSAEAP
ncbi:Serine/threonine protein kinase [Handroanthus impetiginosus]|uniref:Serine/threonine protein kinase n=1 Tax=Handroanthus impetiginosus TaxID=429701 RepID=A0A2G9HMT3_9LAMI|nr:Serine/threonine protein kinase [Handroanthus impetiginosus]